MAVSSFFDEDDIARASLYGDRYICPHFQYEMSIELLESRFKLYWKKVLTNQVMFFNIK